MYQIRVNGLAQNCQQRVCHSEFACIHGLVFRRKANHDVVNTAAQVIQVLVQAKTGHNLGCGRDVEAVLARNAIAVESDNNVAQGAVIHVHHALPRYLVLVQARCFVEKRVINYGCKQVISGGYGREIPCEAQVNTLTRCNAGCTATRGTAFAPEHRSHTGLPQG